ncbi:MAG: tetratricopeptide repeat protein [Calditrichaceae bacterium]
MLNPRKKMTKKEIKEDKFVEVALNAKAYVEDNYKQVSIIVASVFGVILLLMVWNYVHKQNAEESAALLGQAQLEYQNLNYSKAKDFIIRLKEEYPGTDASDQGTFLYANLLYQEKNFEEAKEFYKEFIDSYSGSNILLASGLAGYAACLEKENNFEEAAEYYIRAQKKAKDFIEAPNYLYLAGLNFTTANNYDEARDAFQEIVDDYESSDHQNDAKAKLIMLANK